MEFLRKLFKRSQVTTAKHRRPANVPNPRKPLTEEEFRLFPLLDDVDDAFFDRWQKGSCL